MKTRYFPLLGIALFIYIISKLNIFKIAETLTSADPKYLALAILLYPIPLSLQVLKWHIILNSCGIKYPLKQTYKLWIIGFFSGMLTPGRVGEASKAYYLRRDGFKTEKAAISVILDRGIEVFVLAVLGLLGVAFLFFWYEINLALVLLILLLGLSFMFLLMEKRLVVPLARPFFHRFLSDDRKPDARLTFNEFYSQLTKVKKRRIIFSMSLVTWLVYGYQWHLLALSLNLNIDYFYILAVVPINAIASALPISISGLGTREAIFIFLFTPLGINAVEAVSFAFLALIYTWIPALLGLMLWLRHHRST